MQIHDNQGNIIDDLNPLPTKEVDSTIVKPVKIDSHTATTTQTHNAVSVPLSTTVLSNWIDCDGFSEAAVTMMLDASFVSDARFYWSNDGVNIQGAENVLASASPSFSNTRAGSAPTKARYVKVGITNGDAGAAHTMSAWLYLKS